MKNHYQTLGIKRDASNDDIKKAYRKLAQKFHPDKNDGDKFFEERFKEIQEAYEILSDLYEKGKYDSNYDYFFNGQRKSSQTYTHKEETKYETTKSDSEKVKQEKEAREKREKERVEKERVANIKKNAELQFEDKAWIFLGNWFIIPGAIGLCMFFKYRREGYTKKSNAVCSLTIVSFVVLFILTIISFIAKEAGR
ncbi:DnaJ domain-containing protein [Myroides ceti]|uniref:DnaJ domain-containing protein n=1 Tax=Paenimyroides ceti TaxID=395087 RepID=A0ABT8D102_9FLAO|nr:DnaJ domain-containing protein [Paenimyroides ceti]MDN3706549.1 DnaJ domain-containing protein [Paenimyroides ceti]MDN3710297.1 DnaJ domain-containing protein [Paenimyroides ceti]MDN3710335.1 DnaJ domain-containing protein [Paenimyroides ceti]